MLTIATASPSTASTLKGVLQIFSLATGLHINFFKTCFVPLHTPPTIQNTIASILACPISSFSQIYLGLPPSPNHFLPILERCTKIPLRLACQPSVQPLRLALITNIIESLLIYFMLHFPFANKLMLLDVLSFGQQRTLVQRLNVSLLGIMYVNLKSSVI